MANQYTGGKSLAERFWAKVEKTDGCWLWLGGKNSLGYGSLWYARSNKKAHHVAWFLAKESWPTYLCHSCDNPACVNLAHLFEGNALINARDRNSKGRGIKLGQHARGERAGGAKLTEDAVRRIRGLRAEGKLQRELAEMYGVSEKAIADIVSGDTWAHV